MSIYKKVFVDSLKNVWYNPKYWVFGLFAIFFGGTVELELFDSFFSQSRNIFFDLSSSSFGLFLNPAVLSKIPEAASADAGYFAKLLFIFLVFAVIMAVIIILAVLAQLVIINKVYQGKKNKQLVDVNKESYKELLMSNIDKLWPAISLNVLYKVFIVILFIIIGLPIIITANNPVFWTDVVYMLLFIVLLPVAIVSSMLLRYATIYIKIKNQAIKEALVNAWELFKKNWLLTSEISILMFFFTVIASLLVIVLIMSLSIPYYFLSLALSFVLPQQFALVLVGLFLLIAFIIFIVGAAMISTYNIAIWTNLFSEIENKPKEGKIAQVLNKLHIN